MKILHTADFHIGVNIDTKDFGRGETNRIYEIINVLDEIASYCKDVDILNIAGDIFHFSFPAPYLVGIFQNFLNKVLSINPSIKIFMIPGNHDFSSISFKHALMSIKEAGQKNIYVFDKLESMEIGNCNFVFVPFIGKYFDIANISNQIKSMVIKDKHNILVGHFTYAGAEIGSEKYMLRDGWAVNESIKGFELILLGHIHKSQNIEMAFYPGSPIETDVGEREDNKGFLMFNMNETCPNGHDADFITLKSYLKYKLIELDHMPTLEELTNKYPVTDQNIVVLRMKIKKEENVNINLIKEYLEKANFYKIEIEYTDVIQTRQEGITEKIDPLTALTKYIEADKNCMYPQEIIQQAISTFAEMNKH